KFRRQASAQEGRQRVVGDLAIVFFQTVARRSLHQQRNAENDNKSDSEVLHDKKSEVARIRKHSRCPRSLGIGILLYARIQEAIGEKARKSEHKNTRRRTDEIEDTSPNR